MSDYNSIDEKNYPVIDNGNSSARRFELEWDGNSNFRSLEPINPIDPNTGWFRTHWRPAMAWLYGFIVLFDFFIAPSVMLYFNNGTQWEPLTMVSGGLFHIAMGAIVGVTAYGRTKEKMVGVDGE